MPGSPGPGKIAVMTVLPLPDGRRLGWAEYGDPTGTPVVFLHGTPNSRLFHPPDEVLDGIRLITFDRPGYGLSDPMRRPKMTAVAEDVGVLATACGVDRFGVVGFSGGAPYALACGAVLRTRVIGVGAAALTGPDRELRTLTGAERRTVWRLRTVPGLGRRYLTKAAAAYSVDPNYESTVEGTRPGRAGLIGDWLATDINRWGFRLSDVRVPVRIWAGRKDPGRAAPDAPLVAARIPDAVVRIDEDAGHTPSAPGWRWLVDGAAGS